MALRYGFHIILNPVAGARRRGLLDDVIRRLRASGASVTVELTTHAGHATELARKAVHSGVDVVVAAGGDGTINEVARGLLGHSVPLGIIPLGTANVLAIEIGLHPKADDIADMLLRGPAELVGTGVVDGEIFLLMAGIGFDGEVVRNINPRLKCLWGKGSFIWSDLKKWLSGPSYEIDLVVDGRPKKAAWVIATNARHYAGPFVLAPDESVTRSGLTLFLFRSPSRFSFLVYLAALGLGMVPKLSGVEVLPARRVEVVSPTGVAVEIDGDARGFLPLTIEQGVHLLRLVVPPR